MRPSVRSQSPIFSELDRKTKEAIDARLKEIDDEFESNRKHHFVFPLVEHAEKVSST